MEVASGGGDAGVAKGSLDQMNRRAAIKGVGSMGVAEPVGRDGQLDAVAPGSLPHDAVDGQGPENAA